MSQLINYKLTCPYCEKQAILALPDLSDTLDKGPFLKRECHYCNKIYDISILNTTVSSILDGVKGADQPFGAVD